MALNFPISPVNGQLYVDTTSGNRYIYESATTKWKYSANNTPTGSVYISNTAPPSAVSGDLWWNSDLGTLFLYYSDVDTNQWVETSPSGGVAPSVPLVQINNVAPTNPIAGTLWWNKDYGRLLIYYTDVNSSQWVDATPLNDPTPIYNVANAAFNKANSFTSQSIAYAVAMGI